MGDELLVLRRLHLLHRPQGRDRPSAGLPRRPDGQRPAHPHRRRHHEPAPAHRRRQAGRRQDPDQGILLPSAGRSFVGAEITTAHGTVAVYNTHLALARQVSDAVRAGDVRRIQELTEARPGPSVVTGDFNQTIDDPPDRSPETAAAIRAFMDTYGYTDVARDQGPTIDEKHRDRDSRRIDFVLVRGVGTTDTVRFESHESDHWGLATTLA